MQKEQAEKPLNRHVLPRKSTEAATRGGGGTDPQPRIGRGATATFTVASCRRGQTTAAEASPRARSLDVANPVGPSGSLGTSWMVAPITGEGTLAPERLRSIGAALDGTGNQLLRSQDTCRIASVRQRCRNSCWNHKTV